MSYTAMDELDLIKANKLKLIDKINELLGVETDLTWTSTWTEIEEKIASLKTLLPEEDTEVHQEIDNFLQNVNIGNIKISSEKINEKTFYNKTSLETITGKFVKTIGSQAFYGCNNLLSAEFENCTSTSTSNFYDCTRLTTVKLPQVSTLSTQLFYNCSKLSNLDLKSNDIIAVPTKTFYNCRLLPIVHTTFPNLVTISNYGFYYCEKLVDLDWSKITSIGEYSLRYCTGLTTLDLSTCTATIGQYALANCTGLHNIVIGEKIGTIANYAFSSSGTCDIYCELTAKPESWGTSWFGGHTVYWNAKLRDYTFVVNNGDENIVLNKRVIKNDDLPSIIREGYEFDSWYLDSDFKTELSCPYVSSNKLNIYARWIRGYNLVAVDYDTLIQHTLGTRYYNNILDLPQQIDTYACVGYYSDSNLTNLVTELTEAQLPGATPTLYIKATPAAEHTEIYDFDYTGSEQEFTFLPGSHKFECWGAQGGNNRAGYDGGKGGYSCGTLQLSKTETGYIAVGGVGHTASAGNISSPGGFNGGGATGKSSNSTTTNNGGSGGGASDIRLNENSLYARVIVAGGGGGAGYDGIGGAGGGTDGIRAGTVDRDSYPGTQVSGGEKAPTSENNPGITSGSFGLGGNGGGYGYVGGSGGGGGWYGGGGAGGGSYNVGRAAGGSGYVYTSETASNYPTGCLLEAKYYLTEAQTIAGNQQFQSPEGITESGHAGNGHIRITSTLGDKEKAIYGTVELNIINRDTMQEEPVIIKQYWTNIYTPITLENWIDLEPITLENWIDLDWYFDKGMTTKVIYPLEIKLNDVIKLYSFGTEQIIYDFKYTGNMQEFILPVGTYMLECWGAQGGSNQSFSYGLGGYSCGNLTIDVDTQLYIYVGGQGIYSDRTIVTNLSGGYNGGGSCYSFDGFHHAGSGGGGSDIRLGQNSMYARVIVAGGGGGNGIASSVYYKGGAAGGLTGQIGETSSGYSGGGGGTQTTGGAKGSDSRYSSVGTFGYGGSQTGNSGGWSACGGGGGWYGGGSGGAVAAGGGGGSGYVYTNETADSYPSGCLLNSSYFLTDAKTIAGNQQFSSPAGIIETGHSGNGYVRITKIKS